MTQDQGTSCFLVDALGRLAPTRTTASKCRTSRPKPFTTARGSRAEHELQVCYDLASWECDSSKNGYPPLTEEQCAYPLPGGNHYPYYPYGWGNTLDGFKPICRS